MPSPASTTPIVVSRGVSDQQYQLAAMAYERALTRLVKGQRRPNRTMTPRIQTLIEDCREQWGREVM